MSKSSILWDGLVSAIQQSLPILRNLTDIPHEVTEGLYCTVLDGPFNPHTPNVTKLTLAGRLDDCAVIEDNLAQAGYTDLADHIGRIVRPVRAAWVRYSYGSM